MAMIEITNGISFGKNNVKINGEEIVINIIKYKQEYNKNLTMLLSKVSEAIMPNASFNHIGEGASIDTFLKSQKGIRFVINGGFSHYRKSYYEWHNDHYNIGDPVGLIKIRQHLYKDYLKLDGYGFLTQKEKGDNWEIKNNDNLDIDSKYILGCTPLLIFNRKALPLNINDMQPMPLGKINPPSVLGHGMEKHPRTAVGIKKDCLYFITLSTPDGSSGCSLIDLQKIGINFKFDFFLNLDGGGSSQFRLVKDEETFKNKVKKGENFRILGNVIVIFDDEMKK